MQIIDELEVARRGPYGGGIGHVSFTGGGRELLLCMGAHRSWALTVHGRWLPCRAGRSLVVLCGVASSGSPRP